MTKHKVEKLTDSQEAMLPIYRNKAIEVGMKADPTLDEKKVRELTDAHRVLCGVQPATEFLVLDSPGAAFKFNSNLTPSNALFGSHDVNWLYFYLFFRVECGLREETEKLKNLIELCGHTGWMWMSSDTTIVTRRPAQLHTIPKANGLLVCHNSRGKAIEYVDGWGVYCLDGVRIPTPHVHLVTNPNPTEILKIQNSEIRGALIKNMGPEVMFQALPHSILHQAEVKNGGHYTLYKIDIEGQSRHYLSGVCPSKGDRWYEAVPPTCVTVESSLAWREWGDDTIPYLPPVIRT